jgi:hypothetical protein
VDLAHRLLKELNELYETLGPEQALKEAIDRYIRYHHVNWEGTVFIYKEMGTMAPSLRLPLVELNSHMHELFTRIINKGCKAGVFSTADSELTAGTIVSMGDMWALKRWYFKKNYSLEKYIHSVTAMIYNLVSAEADTVDSQ